MDKVLEVRNVTKLYKKNRGIEDISFDIFRGDVYGFLGPNGSGKTTMMKVITGLAHKSKGKIKIFDHDIDENPEKAMEKVGAVIEAADSYEYMSAYKNLKLASRFYENIKDEKIDELLNIVNLTDFKNEKTGQFSLGMKQRLALAAALISEPEFIILDEPTNGLDIEGVVEIRNIIKKLAQEKKITFFISSHVVHEIELICNRVGIIYNGRLISQASVEDITKGNMNLEEYFLKCVGKGRGETINE